ncbi:MAG: tRNA (adenosine(37)-N6)-threonylcarbamoyltransferase complex transferase subunit TsaD [bacterium]
MKILSIETSCDESAISILEVKGGIKNPSFKILGDALRSQIKIHEQYGGVFPMMAKREHQKNLVPILINVLKQAKFYKKNLKSFEENHSSLSHLNRETDLIEHFKKHVLNIKKPKIDLIAVTNGPGLEPALWVGISFAKALGELWNIPVMGVNHMEGHILSVLPNRKEFSISNFQFPMIALLVSGGHTELVLMKKFLSYEVLGKTRDDAAGEAFDKVARILGLSYPGGPEISKLANIARSSKLEKLDPSLPRPMIKSKDLDFSFSGLKTAVLYMVRDMGILSEIDKEKIAREFEDSTVDVLESKTRTAILESNAKSLIIGGGVSANKELQKRLRSMSKSLGIDFYLPEKKMSTDNAIMIGICAFFNSSNVSNSSKEIEAKGNLGF